MNTQDIDLFNRQSNTQINNTLSTTGAQSWSGSTHATLYLLKQRRIPDQMRRSHLYQFGGQFRDDLMNNLNDAMTTNHRYTAKDAMMPDVISAREAVLKLRKKEFFEEQVPEFFRTMKALDITMDQVIACGKYACAFLATILTPNGMI